MRLFICSCTVFLVATILALISEAKRHGKSEWRENKETELIYTEVLHNITRVNKELQDLLQNYNKLKGIYYQHSSFEVNSKDEENEVKRNNESRKVIKKHKSTTDGPTRSSDLPTQMFELVEDDENSTEMETENRPTPKANKDAKNQRQTDEPVIDSRELLELRTDKHNRFKVKHKIKRGKDTKVILEKERSKKKHHKTTPSTDIIGVRNGKLVDTSSKEDRGTILHYGNKNKSAQRHKEDAPPEKPNHYNKTESKRNGRLRYRKKMRKKISRFVKGATGMTKRKPLYKNKNHRRVFNGSGPDTNKDSDTETESSSLGSTRDEGSETDDTSSESRSKHPDESNEYNETRRFSRTVENIFDDKIFSKAKGNFDPVRTRILPESKPLLRRTCIDPERTKCKKIVVKQCYRAGMGCMKRVCQTYNCKSGFKEEFNQILRRQCIYYFNASNTADSLSDSSSNDIKETKLNIDEETKKEEGKREKKQSKDKKGKKSKQEKTKTQKSKETTEDEMVEKKDKKKKKEDRGEAKSGDKKKDKKNKDKGKKNKDKSRSESENESKAKMKADSSEFDDLTRHGISTPFRRSVYHLGVAGGLRHKTSLPRKKLKHITLTTKANKEITRVPKVLAKDIRERLNEGKMMKENTSVQVKGEDKIKGLQAVETIAGNKTQVQKLSLGGHSKLGVGRKKKDKKCCCDGARPICVKACHDTYTQACSAYECLKDKLRAFKKRCKEFCKLSFREKSSSSSSGSSDSDSGSSDSDSGSSDSESSDSDRGSSDNEDSAGYRGSSS